MALWFTLILSTNYILYCNIMRMPKLKLTVSIYGSEYIIPDVSTLWLLVVFIS